MGRAGRAVAIVLLVALAAFVGAACAGRGSIRSPADVSSPLVEQLLGGPPDFAMTLRLHRAMADPLYGPLVRCAAALVTSSIAEAQELASSTEAIDAWIREDSPDLDQMSMLVVLRGAPRFDPTAYRTAGAGSAEWLPARAIGAGVFEHAAAPGGLGASIFLTAEGTAVLARGKAIVRARALLSRGYAVPAALELEPAAIAGAWATGAPVLRRSMELSRDLAGLVAASAALLPGPDLAAVLRVQLETEARAANAETHLRNWGDKDCAWCARFAKHLHVERDGREVRIDVRAPGSELDDARAVACAPRVTVPVAQPLPADWTKPELAPPRVAWIAGRDLVVSWAPEARSGKPANGETDLAQRLGVYDERGRLLYRVEHETLHKWKADADNAFVPASDFVIAGNQIVLREAPPTAEDGKVSIFDVKTGKRTSEVAIAARGRLCASTTEPLVFVEDKDAARQTVIRADTGQAAPSPRPPWCPEPGSAKPCADQPSTIATCLDTVFAPAIPGMVAQHVLMLGDDAVVLGEHAESGRRVPVAAGFDFHTRAVRWKRVLPTVSPDVAEEGAPRIADLAYGKLFVEFDDWHGKWKLAAIEAKTGVTSWEVPMKEPLYIGISPTRVWFQDVERSPRAVPDVKTTLRALDLATGRPVAP